LGDAAVVAANKGTVGPHVAIGPAANRHRFVEQGDFHVGRAALPDPQTGLQLQVDAPAFQQVQEVFGDDRPGVQQQPSLGVVERVAQPGPNLEQGVIGAYHSSLVVSASPENNTAASAVPLKV